MRKDRMKVGSYVLHNVSNHTESEVDKCHVMKTKKKNMNSDWDPNQLAN